MDEYIRNYYDNERLPDPETGLNDEQIKKELDELNKQI